jgi:hypothetical protein
MVRHNDSAQPAAGVFRNRYVKGAPGGNAAAGPNRCQPMEAELREHGHAPVSISDRVWFFHQTIGSWTTLPFWVRSDCSSGPVRNTANNPMIHKGTIFTADKSIIGRFHGELAMTFMKDTIRGLTSRPITQPIYLQLARLCDAGMNYGGERVVELIVRPHQR